jgi:hypothetical protein
MTIEIPEDIMKVATAIWRRYHKTSLVAIDLPKEIGEAILAERSRAAKIADEQRDEWRNALTSGGTRNVDYANGRSHGAEVIAAEIRGDQS